MKRSRSRGNDCLGQARPLRLLQGAFLPPGGKSSPNVLRGPAQAGPPGGPSPARSKDRGPGGTESGDLPASRPPTSQGGASAFRQSPPSRPCRRLGCPIRSCNRVCSLACRTHVGRGSRGSFPRDAPPHGRRGQTRDGTAEMAPEGRAHARLSLPSWASAAGAGGLEAVQPRPQPE